MSLKTQQIPGEEALRMIESRAAERRGRQRVSRRPPVQPANLDVQSLAAEIAAAIRIGQAPEHPFSPWLNAVEAAAYLRRPKSRVRKLTSTRELPCHRDGRRVLFHRDELDDYVRAGGATCP